VAVEMRVHAVKPQERLPVMQSRQFLTSIGAAAWLPGQLGASESVMPRLETRVRKVQLAPPAYPKTEIWGYEGRMPGPEIRMRQGQRVRRKFRNDLPQATSVH